MSYYPASPKSLRTLTFLLVQVLGTSDICWTDLNPVWDQQFMLPYKEKLIADENDLELRIIMYDRNMTSTDTFLGQVVLCGDKLRHGKGDPMELNLERRGDVASDTKRIVTGKLTISLSFEVEQPFQKVVQQMIPPLGRDMVVIEVASIDWSAYMKSRKEQYSSPPLFYAVLSIAGGAQGRTGKAESKGTEVSFSNEFFCFNVELEGDRASNAALPEEEGTLEQDMVDERVRVDIYGEFKLQPHGAAAEVESVPQTRHLGCLCFLKSQLLEAPVYQTVYPLLKPIEHTAKLGSNFPPTLKKFSRTNAELARITVRLGLCYLNKLSPSPFPFCDDPHSALSFPRIRLRVTGVIPERKMANSMPHGFSYYTEIHWDGRKAETLETRALDGSKLQVDQPDGEREFLLSLGGWDSCRSSALVMKVFEKGISQKNGLSGPEDSQFMGQVCVNNP